MALQFPDCLGILISLIIPFLKIQLKVMKTIILLILSIVLIFPAYGEKPVPMGMVLIQKGAFQMGSKKSMLELRPHAVSYTHLTLPTKA